MADDVKVKFGGDFTGVAKGGQSAVKQAGTALGSYFSDMGSSIMGSIGGMFSAGAVVGKVTEKFQAAGEYFRELIHIMKITGESAESLQKIMAVGKAVGISTEVMGKSLGLFSKFMGNASKDAEGHGKVLKELGFDTAAITAGTISSTDVLIALAKQLEKTGNSYLVAANASAVFGRSGRELMPIVRQGSEAIKEAVDETKVYTQAQIEAVEASERVWAKRGRAFTGFFKEAWRKLTDESSSLVTASVDEARDKVTKSRKEKGLSELTYDEMTTNPDYQEEFIKSAGKRGLGLEWLKENTTTGVEKGKWTVSQGFLDVLKKVEEDRKRTIEENKAKGMPGEDGVSALSTSSLQAIGGGDINSILSGTYQDTMLDAAKRTAENTQKIAEKQPNNRPTLTVTK